MVKNGCYIFLKVKGMSFEILIFPNNSKKQKTKLEILTNKNNNPDKRKALPDCYFGICA